MGARYSYLSLNNHDCSWYFHFLFVFFGFFCLFVFFIFKPIKMLTEKKQLYIILVDSILLHPKTLV